ncbi:putative rhamnosyltransferase [Litoreibacter halocynthiae]|uniref:Putative rhamnosyltransferase n=1 Tax=Litoreibacter halocynthiae TaxID=1242689 RepID=A0A4R7LNN2_9RHOB|nr:glycosyltransferase [Litoreibacter halocynthiae]TDT77658.1 putative rhamnosyltransferase [Litoreibacter halocynthiae]
MKLVFETRFSFLGKSGWKSEVSEKPQLLFNAKRMLRRFELFEKITLPSLRDQTDKEFSLLLLCSKRMPDEYRQHLEWLCSRYLHQDQYEILVKRPRVAGKVFREHVTEVYKDERFIIQTVLDDDDAVCSDFVEICKREAELVAQRSYDGEPSHFLSFARGYSLLVENGRLEGLTMKHSPFVNLGLSLVAPPDSVKNPFLTSHLAIGARHPSTVVNTLRPFYLRTIHDQNDSRTPHKTDAIDGDEFEKACTYFPFLRKYQSLKMAFGEAAE